MYEKMKRMKLRENLFIYCDNSKYIKEQESLIVNVLFVDTYGE